MTFIYEFKKLALSPLVLSLAALCILVNLMFLLVEYDGMTPQNQDHSAADALAAEAANIFEGYRTAGIAEFYISALRLTGTNAEHIRGKYEALQLVVDRRAAGGDAPRTYFDGQTSDFQVLLFGKLFMYLSAEVGLLALLAALLSTTHEQMRGTESAIYASKTGRRVQVVKLCASLSVSALLSVLVIGLSLLIFFALFDFSIVWNANVSSVFDHALGETKPFITWHSFTVAGYLWAAIGIGIGLALCCCLLGYACGIGARSAYLAFGTAVSVLAILYLIPRAPFMPYGSIARGAWGLNPVWLWKSSGTWFTDGRADMVWAHFETLGLCASLAVFAAAAGFAYRSLQRRELH
ncbi:hypothetical protein QWJ34_26395 [Saccharibacillus sp. CPCC 101409]|uniref:hypothetical protein n=1 Tax=Saccharibacillus sp. CPCC 101409 TaxID=3058041 RepID=UPI0026737A89|nr:hypothetical protein [Saccharibacillus sp. CPCC 101409]MDO3413310.1 hypothetical protein [Saccharibacillus sp. CPCC 101409]